MFAVTQAQFRLESVVCFRSCVLHMIHYSTYIKYSLWTSERLWPHDYIRRTEQKSSGLSLFFENLCFTTGCNMYYLQLCKRNLILTSRPYYTGHVKSCYLLNPPVIFLFCSLIMNASFFILKLRINKRD